MSNPPYAPNIHRLAVCSRSRRLSACATDRNPSPRPCFPSPPQQGLRRLAGRTAACPLSHEFSLQFVNHCLIPGSYQMDAIAAVRTRSHAERRFSTFRLKRYDEAFGLTRRKPHPLRLGKVDCTTHRRVRSSAGGDVASPAVEEIRMSRYSGRSLHSSIQF